MENTNILESKTQWALLDTFGITNPITYITADTVIATWAVIILLISTVLLCQFFLKKKDSYVRHVTLGFIKSFMGLCTQTLGIFHYKHFSFIISLFIFILYSNLLGIIPFLEEPTTDINTTLALGLVAFLYTNFYSIKAQGPKKYIAEYFYPFFIMFPLNIVGKLASIVSISFRLFGNLFGGSMISNIYMSAIGHSPLAGAVGLLSGTNLLIVFYFGIFEGCIQAFVFAILSLTYLSIGIQTKET